MQDFMLTQIKSRGFFAESEQGEKEDGANCEKIREIARK
jgi:hypothetical protein